MFVRESGTISGRPGHIGKACQVARAAGKLLSERVQQQTDELYERDADRCQHKISDRCVGRTETQLPHRYVEAREQHGSEYGDVY